MNKPDRLTQQLNVALSVKTRQSLLQSCDDVQEVNVYTAILKRPNVTAYRTSCDRVKEIKAACRQAVSWTAAFSSAWMALAQKAEELN